MLLFGAAGCGSTKHAVAPAPNPAGALTHCLQGRLGFDPAKTRSLPAGAVDGETVALGGVELDVLLTRDPAEAVKLEQSLGGSAAGRKSNVVFRVKGGRLDPLLRSHLLSCFA